jgi:hypothetical protein
MSTAAVGDSPKIVVRSVTAERGRADAPSSVFVVLLVLELERSELTLPEVLPPGAGALSVPDALPLAPPGAGVLTLPDEELELDPGAGAGVAGADVELEDEDDPWASTSDTGAASNATPSRAANKAFIPHLLVGNWQQGRCH